MTPNPTLSIAQNRAEILQKIKAAAPERDVTLVAVSKVQPDARIEAALEAGQRVFGENRVQEAQHRWATRRSAHPDLELRLIGPLQTNKAEEAVTLFDVIETLDRPKLARALRKAIDKTGQTPRLLIQVNTGEEPQKAGIVPAGLPDLLKIATQDCALSIEGLMCIPPADEPAGPHFALLADLARTHRLSELSMGMSADYALGAAFGATHVRVGTAFFGPRDHKKAQDPSG